MGLIKRVSDILSANLNDLVDNFEDPEKMLRLAIREMEAQVAQAMDAAARAVAGERLLRRERDEHGRQVETWRERARQALARSDDTLARRAAGRVLDHRAQVTALEQQTASATEASERLRRDVEDMQAQLTEARRKLGTLCVRKRNADLLRQGGKSKRARGGEGFARFAALGDKIERSQAEAEAWVELTATLDTGLVRSLEAQEREQEIDAELARLAPPAK